MDSEKIAHILTTVHAQVITALWLSAGMVLAIFAIVCVAFGARRPALVFGFGYSITLFFMHNGHALVLGPSGCAVSLIGLMWPQRKAPNRPNNR